MSTMKTTCCPITPARRARDFAAHDGICGFCGAEFSVDNGFGTSRAACNHSAVPQKQVFHQQLSDVPVSMIIACVANYYGVSEIDIVSARRTANVIRPRHVAMYLARRLTGKSYAQIGRAFGDRDHATVIHAVNRVTGEMAGDMAGWHLTIDAVIERIATAAEAHAFSMAARVRANTLRSLRAGIFTETEGAR